MNLRPDPHFKECVKLVRTAGDSSPVTAGECIEQNDFKADGSLNRGWDVDDPGADHWPVNKSSPIKNKADEESCSTKIDWIAYYSEYDLVSVQMRLDLT